MDMYARANGAGYLQVEGTTSNSVAASWLISLPLCMHACTCTCAARQSREPGGSQAAGCQRRHAECMCRMCSCAGVLDGGPAERGPRTGRMARRPAGCTPRWPRPWSRRRAPRPRPRWRLPRGSGRPPRPRRPPGERCAPLFGHAEHADRETILQATHHCDRMCVTSAV